MSPISSTGKEQWKKIRIFDIDGTITHPGIDLWYMTTKSISSDIESFDKHILAWKNGIKSGSTTYKTSKSIMLKGLNLMQSEITGNDIR